jgi:F-type H+-transporting ATPase subunit b
MLEINQWIIVLALNFFVLLFILHFILYKPLLKLFKERQDIVKGSLDAAKKMNAIREDSVSRLNRELAEARSKAGGIFEALRAEGIQQQREVVSKAEAEASEIVEKARAELRAETERAGKALRAEVDKFSDEIVRKLVGA